MRGRGLVAAAVCVVVIVLGGPSQPVPWVIGIVLGAIVLPWPGIAVWLQGLVVGYRRWPIRTGDSDVRRKLGKVGFVHDSYMPRGREYLRRSSSQVDVPRGGSSVGQSRGLIILRSQVRVLPAPPIYLRRYPRGLWAWTNRGLVDSPEAAVKNVHRPRGYIAASNSPSTCTTRRRAFGYIVRKSRKSAQPSSVSLPVAHQAERERSSRGRL
jgi:hypothetical protein